MKALRVHGGEATSKRISVRDGGRAPTAPAGVEWPDMNASLIGLEGGSSTSKKSSKADEGRGESSCEQGPMESAD